MTVGVIVVSWNSASTLRECLEAARAQVLASGESVRVLVVDNASEDDSVAIARAVPGVELIENTGNSGFAHANNQAWTALADCSRMMLLNPDCVMDAGCLDQLVAALHRRADIGIAAARLRYPDGTDQSFARRLPSVGSHWWCVTTLGATLDTRFLGQRHQRRRWYSVEFADPSRDVEVEAAAAACVVLRRTDAGRTLFDERFPLLYNDVDLYWRLRGAGKGTLVVADATARHAYGKSLREVPRARLQAEEVRSAVTFARLHWGVGARVGLRLCLLVDLAFCLVSGRVRQRDQDVQRARGIAGGLRLPGGARPWLS
jgi:GT2 family glycosyltransferase